MIDYIFSLSSVSNQADVGDVRPNKECTAQNEDHYVIKDQSEQS
jgi:hypothetical protein